MSQHFTRSFCVVSLLAASLLIGTSATAQNLDWRGTSSSFLWNLDPNNQVWGNSSGQNVGWVNGSDATFSSGFASVTVAAAIAAGTVTFATNFTLEDGGGTLQANIFNAAAGVTARINAVLAGSNGFTKTGNGRLELNAANAVSGTVNINAGGLDILAADALRNATVSANTVGALSFAVNANFGGLAGSSSFSLAQRSLTVGFNNLDSTFSGNISGNNPNTNATTFTKVGAGTLAITGDWSGLAGRREIDGGFVAVNGLSFFNNLVTINNAGIRFDADLTLGATTNLSRTVATTFDTNGHNVSFSGSFAGNGAFTKIGGGTLTLIPTNFVATTDVSILGGTLFVNNKNNIGPFAADRTFTLDGGTFSDGMNGGENFASAVVLGSGGGTIDVRDPQGDLFFTGGFSGAGGLRKTGAGTLNLGAGATYLGATTVTGGTLRTFAAATLPAATALSVANATVILDRGQAIGSLAGSGTVQITSGTLAIGSDNTSTTFSGAVTGDGSIAKNGGGALTLSGANTFTGALTVEAGTLTLSGTNSYTGATTVNGGNLVSPAGGSLPSNTALVINGGSVDFSLGNNVTLGSLASLSGTGGTLVLGNMQLTLSGNASTSYAGLISGGASASLTKNGIGTFTLSGSTTVLNIAINAGAFQLGSTANALPDSGSVALATGTTFRLGSVDETTGSVTGGGTIDFGSGTPRTLQLNGNGSTVSFSGTIAGNGNVVFALGSGATYILTGTNTYTGNTTVNSGQLRTGAIGSVLPDATTVQLLGGASVSLGANETIGALIGATGTVAVLNGHTLTTGGNNSSTSFDGSFFGAGALTKQGTGTMTLTAGSTYNGGTEVDAGTLVASHNTALGSGAVSVASPGTLEVSGSGVVVGNSVTGSGGLVRVQNGATASNVTITNGGIAETNGTITTLALNGGTLRGAGTVSGAVAVGTNDIIAPGNSPGLLTVGSLSFDAGGRYSFELRDAAGAAGVGYDSINDLGNLSITATPGAQFNIALTTLNGANQPGLASNFNSAQSYSFVLAHTANGVTGFDPAAFSIDASGFQNGLGGGHFIVGLSGNDLVLNFAAIPEPGSGSLLAVALAGAAVLRGLRRRRSKV
jgi:autotransporter-associated beta strand protein